MERIQIFSRFQRYLLIQFLAILGTCLLASSTLFLVVDLFERMRIFVEEGATFIQAISYLLYKIPLMLQILMPVSLLIATLISVGRLSQNSEIIAMRAGGASVFWLAKPLLTAGLLFSLLGFVLSETVVPWATRRGEEIYHFDIRKKADKGKYSRTNYWYRKDNRFFNIGYYDSRAKKIAALSLFELSNSFVVKRRIDSPEVSWKGSDIGWSMENVAESAADDQGTVYTTKYTKLPLVIDETPADFYQMDRTPESMTYRELKQYAAKLSAEGVPVTDYLVSLAAKISFPFVNLIAVLVAFPFALTSHRSGNMTFSFVMGIGIGFAYYILHAVSISLGSAELLPIAASAWLANIVLGLVGTYYLVGAEIYP